MLSRVQPTSSSSVEGSSGRASAAHLAATRPLGAPPGAGDARRRRIRAQLRRRPAPVRPGHGRAVPRDARAVSRPDRRGPTARSRCGEQPAGMLMVSTDPDVARSLTDEVVGGAPGRRGVVPGAGRGDRARAGLRPGRRGLPPGHRLPGRADGRDPGLWRGGAAGRGDDPRGHRGPTDRPPRPGPRRRDPRAGRFGRRAHRRRDVIVAAGPWSPAIIDPSGRWQPIGPLWGAVVDAALADPPGHAIEEVWTGVEPGDDHPDHAFSLVTAGGRSSIGSCFVPDEPDPAAITPLLLERARRFVPAIADARLGATRVCARPLVPG